MSLHFSEVLRFCLVFLLLESAENMNFNHFYVLSGR